MKTTKSIQFFVIPNKIQSSQIPIEWCDNIAPFKDYANGAYNHNRNRFSLTLHVNKIDNHIVVIIGMLFWDDLNLTDLLTDQQYSQLTQLWHYIENSVQKDVDSFMVYYYPDEDYVSDILICNSTSQTISISPMYQSLLKSIFQLGLNIIARSMSL